MKKKLIKNILYALSILILLLIGAKVYTYYLQKSKRTALINELIQPKDSDIVFGNREAAESIYMFGNYNCSHCISFFKKEFPLIEAEILQAEEINMRLKVIPFTLHEEMLEAYSFAICVNNFGKYEAFHNLLLLDFNLIYSEQFQELKNDIMIKNEAIAQSYLGGEFLDDLKENKKEFMLMKFRGTPTFVFRNKVFTGEISYQDLKEILSNN